MAAAPAPAAASPLVLDAHADTLDHVVRAVVRSGFLPEAVRLMLVSPEHLHDPELLYRTRGVRGAGGTTLLMRAVVRLDVARAAEILGACPTPAARVELLACVDNEGRAALHLACHKDRLDEEAALRLVELLLANGADVQALAREMRCDWHAIHVAAQWSARLVQRLVQAGASIDGDFKHDSTLCAAARLCTAQGVRMIPRLVALGARETHNNWAMFAFAQNTIEGAQPADVEVVAALNALVSVGCSLTQPDDVGWAPLDVAAGDCNATVVRTLLLLGAPATSSSLVLGVKHPEMVRMLLAAGAPVDGLVDVGVGQSHRSPLMEAALASALESMEVLLAAGADVDLREEQGLTALGFSVIGSTFDPCITEALLAAVADVYARDNDGYTVLHYLAAYRAQEPWAAGVAQWLLQRGGDARAVDNAGRTPVQCVPAAQLGGELHRLLLEAAAA